MSRIKEIIIERENTIINLIRCVDCITEKMTDDDADEVWNAWVENGLPFDDEDMDELFDIVTDDELYEYTINTATKFLAELKK